MKVHVDSYLFMSCVCSRNRPISAFAICDFLFSKAVNASYTGNGTSLSKRSTKHYKSKIMLNQFGSDSCCHLEL